MGALMLTRSELPENPVILTVGDASGHQYKVTAERVGGGRIRMVCSCDASRADGWCGHQVQLLCMRYDNVVSRSEDQEFHFEDIILGTPLADVADEVDLALVEYRNALRNIEAKRPDGLSENELRMVAELATDLVEAANHLNGALARFKKRLASGRS